MSNTPCSPVSLLVCWSRLIPGLVNGMLVARVKVPPFIATLGMFGIVRGAAFLLTDGQQVVRGLSAELREALARHRQWQPALPHPRPRTWSGSGNRLTSSRRRFDKCHSLLPYPVLITALVVDRLRLYPGAHQIRPPHLCHRRQRRSGAALRHQCRPALNHYLRDLWIHCRHRRCAASLPFYGWRAPSGRGGAAVLGGGGGHRRHQSIRRRRRYHGRGRRLA